MNTLFLIGNGLGLATKHSDKFKLDEAMKVAWDGTFSDKNKKIISSVMGKDVTKQPPSCEHELHELQEFLWIIEEKGIKNHQELIIEVNYFIAKVVKTFAIENSDLIRDSLLAKTLKNYIRSNNNYCAVATTNYDVLLYGYLIRAPKATLYDPFEGGEKHFDKAYNCYLALHGCPLFEIGNNGAPKKIYIGEYQNNIESHLNSVKNGDIKLEVMLTSEPLKMQEMRNYALLTKYWDKFKDTLSQTKILVCIGYGGNDSHINEVIAEQKDNFDKIYIIEWNYGGEKWYDQEIRTLFWQSKFVSDNIQLISCDNILDQDISKIFAASNSDNHTCWLSES